MLSLSSRFVAVAVLMAACSDSIDDSCPPGTVPEGKVCAQQGGGAAGNAGGISAGAAGSTNGAGQAGAGTGGSSGAGGKGGQVAGGGSSGAAGSGGGLAGEGGAGAGGTGAAGASGGSGLGGLAGNGGGGAGGAGAGPAGGYAGAGSGGSGGGGAAGAAGTGGSAGAGTGGTGGLSTCGNGYIDDFEQCDGTDFGGYKDCHALFPSYAGPLKCTANCVLDSSKCLPITCGDGKAEGDEQCDDGPEWANVTCAQILGANYSDSQKPVCFGCRFIGCTPNDGHNGPLLIPVMLSDSPIKGGIHATEVTRAQYATFLADTSGKPSPDDKVDECTWNDSFVPDATCMKDPAVCDEPGVACLTHPQVCVDFCDAKAFCKHTGRHLCAGEGGQPLGPGGALSSDDLWYRVCSASGQYFYDSASIQLTACNVSGLGHPVSVASFPQCHSGFAGLEGVYDMLGNVAEWENSSCEGIGQGKMGCPVRGGAFVGAYYELGCVQSELQPITSASPAIGFRCCD